MVSPTLSMTAIVLLAVNACSSGTNNGDSGAGGTGVTGDAAGTGGAADAAGVGGTGGAGGASGAGGAGGSHATGGASGAGGASGTGGAGGTGGTGIPTDDCSGIDLQQSGVLDLNLRAVTVSGTVTLNGAALPDQSGSRGQLLFTADKGRTTASVDMGATGPKTYALRLPPATYDIAYRPSSTACTAASLPALPCSGGVLRKGVAITSDGVLDIDVPIVEVSGAVTLKGQPLPSQNASRGSIGFALAGGNLPATYSLGSSGSVSYRVRLIPGTYDVIFNGTSSACTAATPPALPCNAGPLKTNLPLTTSGVLDLDVPIVQLTGSVTLAGAPLPTESASRGALTFVAAGSSAGSVSAKSFGSSGAASYAMSLLPGTYDVIFAASSALCTGATLPQVPCVGGKVTTAVRVSTDGVLDVDLRAVTVSGDVSVKGAPMAAASADRGRLLFTNSVGGTGSPATFGLSGAATYKIRLLAGTYDVSYVANPTLCATSGSTSPLPCNGGRLKNAIALTTDGVLNLDIPVVAVSGTVTLKSAAMPAATVARGALRFAPRDGSGAISTPSFGSSGAVNYVLSLWPGTYDVELVANGKLCAPDAAPPAIPCVGGQLRQAVPLQTDGVLDVDVPAISITGSVNLNGAALPAASADRGNLSFARVATQGGGTLSFALGANTAATYAVTLLPGRHVISHVANAGLCGGASPPAVPCASQTLMGCN